MELGIEFVVFFFLRALLRAPFRGCRAEFYQGSLVFLGFRAKGLGVLIGFRVTGVSCGLDEDFRV